MDCPSSAVHRDSARQLMGTHRFGTIIRQIGMDRAAKILDRRGENNP